MPRFARQHAPGALVHLVSRFVNHAFLMAGQAERDAYLAHLVTALGRNDWRLLAYALMSNHVHLVLLAGEAAPSRLLKPLHVGFARWINRSQGRFGPVFAERATTLLLAPERAAHLIAYVHNNPVRARVVPDPADTPWTSHRALVGDQAAPAWLDAGRALSLAGFDSSASGRAGFHQLVCARMPDPREPSLSGSDGATIRRFARHQVALPVEIASPVAKPGGAKWPLLHPGRPVAEPRWAGDLGRVVDRISRERQIDPGLICSRTRQRRIVEARRLALVVGAILLRRNVGEVGAALGLSCAAASKLLRQSGPLLREAEGIAATLRAEDRVALVV